MDSSCANVTAKTEETKRIFDVFIGTPDKKGRIRKIRTVGYASFVDESTENVIFLKDPFAMSFSLVTAAMDRDFDYYIVTEARARTRFYQDKRITDIDSAGVARLMAGDNAGLVRLEIDLLGQTNIFLSLAAQGLQSI